jgi:hypothetical protein
MASPSDVPFTILPMVLMKADGSPIDLPAIARLCGRSLFGCPPEDRLLAWLVLSGVLPSSPERWEDFRTVTVRQYKEFIRLFALEGYENLIFENATSVTDFGLPNNALMELIHTDVIRTAHHIRYFSHTDPAYASDPDPLLPYHAHMRRMERILYIFASCNRSLSYMQGFNEIVAVLYYTFSEAVIFFNNDWLVLESYVFYTFQRVISLTKLNELFTTHDQSSLILSLMQHFMDLMEKHLPNAARIIKKHDIHPLHFCYRKLNLVFSQDHDMSGLVLLWDALFAHFSEFVEFEYYILIGLLSMVQELLDPNDYSQTMVALQKLNGCANDPRKLIESANRFWKEDHPE